MIESTILIPILEKLERIEDIISGQAKEREALMTVKDVSVYAKCCEATIRRALAKGTIKQCLNHPIVVYRLQFYSPQKAKQSFQRLTGQKMKKDAENGVFYAETYPILHQNEEDGVSK